ncbi:MAG: hypothetical protein N2Z68_02190 [Patescibacteria group bacterium]|nr:hypothetical protein [Patescibacteria group bacterium]
MEYTNPSQINPQDPNSASQPTGSVPPPPPQQQQVGIRSMESDLSSIQESGGEAPQSQIVSAPELSALREAPSSQPSFTPPSASSPTPENLSQPTQPTEPSSFQSAPSSAPEATPRSFSLKSLLTIIGILVLVGAVGFGAYYLTTYLKQKPPVNVSEETQNQLLVALPETPPQEPTPPAEEQPAAVEEAPLVHQSLIVSPTKAGVSTVDGSLDSFKKAIKDASLEKLVVGSTKDLSFVDSSGKLIESSQFLSAFWPNIGSALAPLVERDFTSWLYYDKVGGAKFGLVFTLKDSPSLVETLKSLVNVVEKNVPEVANLFVAQVSSPAKVEFKDGQIEGVAVRFLPFDVKSSNVFEYGWYQVGDRYYLIFATSYNQMVDIIKRIKTLPSSQGVVPPSATSSTSTNP